MKSLIPFESRSSVCVSGQTGSGKTRWVYEFLRSVNDMYSGDPPENILYCYGIYQPLFDEMERTLHNFQSRKGLPSEQEIDEFCEGRSHVLLVIDDLMHAVVQSPDMELLFTRGCHHKGISVIFLTQNLFPRGKHARTIALNTWYLVLMKNMRDVSQVSVLGRQLFPGKSKGLMAAYEDALSQSYGYLILDAAPHSEDRYRVRTRVFPGEEPIVYRLT